MKCAQRDRSKGLQAADVGAARSKATIQSGFDKLQTLNFILTVGVTLMKHSRPCGKCFTHLSVRKMIPSYR